MLVTCTVSLEARVEAALALEGNLALLRPSLPTCQMQYGCRELLWRTHCLEKKDRRQACQWHRAHTLDAQKTLWPATNSCTHRSQCPVVSPISLGSVQTLPRTQRHEESSFLWMGAYQRDDNSFMLGDTPEGRIRFDV